MISTRSLELVIDTVVVCLTLAKWETVSGQFGGYLTIGSQVVALLFAVVRHPRALREVLQRPSFVFHPTLLRFRYRNYASVTEIQKKAIRCYRYFGTRS